MAKEFEKSVLKLLIIDDDQQNLGLIQASLAQEGLQILGTSDPEKASAIFQEQRPQIVLVDLKMPKIGGIELLERIIARDPLTEVILMSGHYSPESAVEAIQKGAADFITKPLNFAALQKRIASSIAEAQRRARALQLDRELVEAFQFEGSIGRSPLMLDVFATIRRVAPHFRTALIMGDTGTGKERVAHALHDLSPGGKNTFAVCNCSALTETLYESELFGYVRGAFTGADQDKVGLFEYAQGGTVFLDEIGDMPLAGQAKLLRVLQNQEVQRIGSPAVKKVDARVIAATNRDLKAMVAEKTFREDLFYRLSMVQIQLPRLSQRREDLPLLERHFVEKFAAQFNKPIRTLSRRAEQVLARYFWPGNVRELENAIGSACMNAAGETIDVSDLPEYLRTGVPSTSDQDDMLSLDAMQRRHAVKVLGRVAGNKTVAAQVLGVSRTTLYHLLSEPDVPKA